MSDAGFDMIAISLRLTATGYVIVKIWAVAVPDVARGNALDRV